LVVETGTFDVVIVGARLIIAQLKGGNGNCFVWEMLSPLITLIKENSAAVFESI